MFSQAELKQILIALSKRADMEDLRDKVSALIATEPAPKLQPYGCSDEFLISIIARLAVPRSPAEEPEDEPRLRVFHRDLHHQSNLLFGPAVRAECYKWMRAHWEEYRGQFDLMYPSGRLSSWVLGDLPITNIL